MQNVQNCTTQTVYENRAVGYNVVYEYAGKQYTVQLPYDPGPTIRLQVSPAGAQQQQSAPGAPMTLADPVPVVTNTVVVPAAYPYYGYGYRPYYYPPVSLSIGYVHGGGHWR